LGRGVVARVAGEQPRLVGRQQQRVGIRSPATMADGLSLSPTRISSVAVVSFSLMIGTTPCSRMALSARRALR
jgi:hypothetical protein